MLSHRLLRHLAIGSVGILTVVSFQNCGKAGFENSDVSDLSSLSNTTDNPRLKNAPFPFEANVNVISYMSCPSASKRLQNQRRFSSMSETPYYNLRMGAFDLYRGPNYSPMPTLNQLAGEAERVKRLTAGVRLKDDYLKYIAKEFARTDLDIVKQSLAEDSRAKNTQLVFGLVKENGLRSLSANSTDASGFAFDTGLFQPTLGILGTGTMRDTLLAQPKISDWGTRPKAFFSTGEAFERRLIGQLAWGRTEMDQQALTGALSNDLMLLLGYMDASMTVDVTQFKSPTKPAETLFGRAYKLQLNSRPAPTTVSGTWNWLEARSSREHFLTGVTEYDVSSKDPKNLSQLEGQKWDCFSLRIVRNVDRVHGSEMSSAGLNRPSMIGRQIELAGEWPTVNSRGQRIAGVKAACPTQRMEYSNDTVTNIRAAYEGLPSVALPTVEAYRKNGLQAPQGTPNDPIYALNMRRLEVARKFLPPELFDINTGPDFSCVVPKDAAAAAGGQCYEIPDTDFNRFVQYENYESDAVFDANGNVTSYKLNLSKPCGESTTNECPAFVSFCYRVM